MNLKNDLQKIWRAKVKIKVQSLPKTQHLKNKKVKDQLLKVPPIMMVKKMKMMKINFLSQKQSKTKNSHLLKLITVPTCLLFVIKFRCSLQIFNNKFKVATSPILLLKRQELNTNGKISGVEKLAQFIWKILNQLKVFLLLPSRKVCLKKKILLIKIVKIS